MHIVTLLLPDFSLILIGIALARWTHWGTTFWQGLEKFVYFILFPALLFYVTARLEFRIADIGPMIKTGILASMCGMALAWAGKMFIKAPPRFYASGMQTAFRFNSYLGLALASRLGDPAAVGFMAMLLGFHVPLCNAAAVYSLAENKKHIARELARNPMLVSTVAGVLYSLCGLPLPDVIATTLSRLGNASIALGLILVGTGLKLSGIRGNTLLATYLTSIKLLVLPCVALLIGQWLRLPPVQLQVVVLFCGLPTATSAYILATRMGGNGPITAFLISISTLLSALTIPFWLAFVQ